MSTTTLDTWLKQSIKCQMQLPSLNSEKNEGGGTEEIKAKSCLRIIRSIMFMGLQHKNYGITQFDVPMRTWVACVVMSWSIKINTNQNEPSSHVFVKLHCLQLKLFQLNFPPTVFLLWNKNGVIFWLLFN